MLGAGCSGRPGRGAPGAVDREPSCPEEEGSTAGAHYRDRLSKPFAGCTWWGRSPQKQHSLTAMSEYGAFGY